MPLLPDQKIISADDHMDIHVMPPGVFEERLPHLVDLADGAENTRRTAAGRFGNRRRIAAVGPQTHEAVSASGVDQTLFKGGESLIMVLGDQDHGRTDRPRRAAERFGGETQRVVTLKRWGRDQHRIERLSQKKGSEVVERRHPQHAPLARSHLLLAVRHRDEVGTVAPAHRLDHRRAALIDPQNPHPHSLSHANRLPPSVNPRRRGQYPARPNAVNRSLA